MRFRLHGDELHVHSCPQHPHGCEFFTDHALAWMIGNREAARAQLEVYRKSVLAHIAAWTIILNDIDAMLGRLRSVVAE